MPLGYQDLYGEYYIYNHIDMVVKLTPTPNKEKTYQIVGYEIEPKSINHEKHKKSQKNAHNNLDLSSTDKIGEYLSHGEKEHEVPHSGMLQ